MCVSSLHHVPFLFFSFIVVCLFQIVCLIVCLFCSIPFNVHRFWELATNYRPSKKKITKRQYFLTMLRLAKVKFRVQHNTQRAKQQWIKQQQQQQQQSSHCTCPHARLYRRCSRFLTLKVSLKRLRSAITRKHLVLHVASHIASAVTPTTQHTHTHTHTRTHTHTHARAHAHALHSLRMMTTTAQADWGTDASSKKYMTYVTHADYPPPYTCALYTY